MPVHPAHRDRNDLCPGLLRTFSAEDGAIVRLRLPGGVASIGLLVKLLRIANDGAGFLQLTSRANLQIRGLPDPLPQRLVDEVLATELVPSVTHERVRNIVSSPLSGIWPANVANGPEGSADIRPVVAQLDRMIRADPMLAQLSGRFLFVVDDGRGDVLGTPFDVAFQAVDGEFGEVRLGTADSPGFRVKLDEAAAALVEVARVFQRVRSETVPQPWHVRELDAGLPGLPLTDLGPARIGPTVEIGPIGPHAVAGLPLGRITHDTVTVLRLMTDRVILTSHRSVVVPGAADRVAELAAAGLTVDPSSGWAKVTACTGAPGCVRAAVSTEAVARRLVADLDAGRIELSEPVHLVACGRNCGVADGTKALLIENESAADLFARLS